MASALAVQVAVMFVLIGVGILIRKKAIVSMDAAKQFSSFVLVAVTPALLVSVFQREFEPALLPAMALMLLLTAGFHFFAGAAARLFFPARGNGEERVERMAAVYSNCGFMGIPLMTAAMGQAGMLYAAIYIAFFNVSVWTHGVMTLTGRLSLKKAFLNPGVLSALLGVTLFLLRIRLPDVLRGALDYMSGMNTPLPMVLTGVFIADVSIKKLLWDKRLYLTCAVRLVALPLLFLAILWVCRVPHWFPGAEQAGLAIVISCSCAVAVSCTLMPARFGSGAERGAELIALSTALSIVTIPAVATLARYVLSR